MGDALLCVKPDDFNMSCTRVEVRPVDDTDFWGRGIGFVAVFYGSNHHERATEYARWFRQNHQGYPYPQPAAKPAAT
jgi:hypothetical protein